MFSECAAIARALTWNTVGSSSPAILYILGIMSKRPWLAVYVVVSAPGGQGAVHGAGGAAFTLHLREAQLLAEHIDAAGRRPFVRDLRHRRGGGDGVDGRDFREAYATWLAAVLPSIVIFFIEKYNLRI